MLNLSSDTPVVFSKIGCKLDELDVSDSNSDSKSELFRYAVPENELGIRQVSHGASSTIVPKFACFTGSAPSMEAELEGEVESDDLEPSMDIVYRSNGDIIDEQLDLIKNLANRGFTLGSLLELVCVLIDKVSAFSEIEDLEAAYICHCGLPVEQWPDLTFFNPATTQTSEVVYRALVPFSRQHCYSFSKILTGHHSCRPQHMVSHTWGNSFVDTVTACVSAAQGKGYFFHVRPRMQSVSKIRELMQDLGPSVLSKTFWLCAISVNQHSVSCHDSPWPCPCRMAKITEGPLSEVGGFDMMMQYLAVRETGFKHVIAADDESFIQVEIQVPSETTRRTLKESKESLHGFGSGSTFTSGSYRYIYGRQSRSIRTYGWCGLQVNWDYRRIVQVNDAQASGFSRSVFPGDVIESVNGNGNAKDMSVSLVAGTGEKTLRLLLRRKLCVTTRIWVVAEIAEAQKRGIPQLLVSHFPLSLSGPEYKLRIKAADVMASEASKSSDRDMILMRISHNAEEYNQRLQRVLLAAPWSWTFFFTDVVLVALLASGVWRVVQGILSGMSVSMALASHFFHSLGLIGIIWMVYFVIRFFWVTRELRVASNLRRDIHDEISRYVKPSLHALWARPFMAIGFMLAGSFKRRMLALSLCLVAVTACYVFGASVHVVIVDCSSEDADFFCKTNTYLRVPWQIVQKMGIYPLVFALVEQHLSLAGQRSMVLLVLSLPFLATFAGGMLFIWQDKLWAGVYLIFWVCLVTMGFEVLSVKISKCIADTWRRLKN